MSTKRLIFSGLISLLAVTALNAGQIKIGSGVGGVNGLTTAYMTNVAPCAGANYSQNGFTGCATAATGGFAERDYQGTLFLGSVPTAAGPNGEGTGLQLTDANNGVTFAMINGDTNKNYWAGASLTATPSVTMTIPVGIFNVSKAWIMLNDYWGVVGVNNNSVTFDFNTKSDGTGVNTAVTVDLFNGNQIRSATECNGAVINSPSCTSFARTTSSGTTTTAFTTAYTGNVGGSAPYAGTAGTLALDDLAFTFNVPLGLWLADIKVTNKNGNANVSRAALSAITIDSAIPEPGSIMLVLGGLSALGLARRRLRLKRS